MEGTGILYQKDLRRRVYCIPGNLTKHILKHHKMEQAEQVGKDDIIVRKVRVSLQPTPDLQYTPQAYCNPVPARFPE